MKRIIAGFIVGVFIIVAARPVSASYTKEELYHMDGPLLTNTIVNVMTREINIIRVELGLQERTGQQLLDALSTELDSLPLYPWMLNQGNE